MRFSRAVLLFLALSVLQARASTTTDTFVFSYTASGVQQSLSFTLPAPDTVSTEDYPVFKFPVQVSGSGYPGSYTTGQLTLDGAFQLDLYDSSGNDTVEYYFLSEPEFNTVELSDGGGDEETFDLTFSANTYTPSFSQAILSPSSPYRQAIGLTDASIVVTAATIATPAAATPEPSTLVLLGTGLVGIGGMVRRRIGAAV